MSTGELCNQKQIILGKKVYCENWEGHKDRHYYHSLITDQWGNGLGAEIFWPNFIGKDKIIEN